MSNMKRQVTIEGKTFVEEVLLLSEENMEPALEKIQEVLLGAGILPTGVNAAAMLYLALSTLKRSCVEKEVVLDLVGSLWPTLAMSPEDEERLRLAKLIPKN